MIPQTVETLKFPVAREAMIDDVDQIHQLMADYTSRGILLPRTKIDIFENLMKFSVLELDRKIVACGALEIFTDELCEIRSLVVSPGAKRRGFGRQLVEVLIERACLMGLSRIMALTYVPEFFHRSGFRTVPKETFPEKVWSVCFKCAKFNDCDEIAVVKELD